MTCRPTGSDLYRHTASPKTCTVIGAPMTHGQPYVGTDNAPTLLRQAGLLPKLSALDWRVEDLHDLDFTTPNNKNPTTTNETQTAAAAAAAAAIGNVRNPWQVSSGTQKLASVVTDALLQGRFPLILGGDHSVAIGSLAGILQAHPNTGVLWIDAHADINTPFISESGNLHGMPVGLLMQHQQPQPIIPAFAWLKDYPQLHPSQIVYIGLRDVDVEERKIITSLGIAAFTMTEIDRYGIGNVMDMALHSLLANDPNRRLHVSYDIDAVDPVLAPATGTTVRGGLSFREAHYVAEAIAATGLLASAEIVELNPTLSNVEGANNTIELGLQIITSLMGKSII